MSINLFAEGLALLGGDIDFGVDIQCHQFFPRLISQHLYEGIVAVEKLPFRSRKEHALLYLLEQQAVAFFGAAPVGRIANHVDRALLLPTLLRVGRG